MLYFLVGCLGFPYKQIKLTQVLILWWIPAQLTLSYPKSL